MKTTIIIVFFTTLTTYSAYCQSYLLSGQARNVTGGDTGIIECRLSVMDDKRVSAGGSFTGDLVGSFANLIGEVIRDERGNKTIQLRGIIDFSNQGGFEIGTKATFQIDIQFIKGEITGVYRIGKILNSVSWIKITQLGILTLKQK